MVVICHAEARDVGIDNFKPGRTPIAKLHIKILPWISGVTRIEVDGLVLFSFDSETFQIGLGPDHGAVVGGGDDIKSLTWFEILAFLDFHTATLLFHAPELFGWVLLPLVS